MKRLEGKPFRQASVATGWIMSAVISTVVLATQIPEPVRDAGGLGLSKAGDGQLSRWGFDIYKASLWAVDPSFDGRTYDKPVMLSIEYQRDIARQHLLENTDTQWRRLGRIEGEQRRAWLTRLEQIWPNVREGDLIACLVYPGDHTRFYSRAELLGIVDDPDFGPEFLAIWLDPRADFKDLRTALIGRPAAVVL